MYCPRCGKPVSDHDAFCGHCGAELPNAKDRDGAATLGASDQDGASAAPPHKRHGPRSVSRRAVIAVGCAGAAAVAAAVAAGIVMRSGGGAATDGDDADLTSTTVDGITVKALARPALITIPTDDDTLGAPALASYRTDGAADEDSSGAEGSTASLSLDLSSVVNAEAFYLDDRDDAFRSLLSDNGFVVALGAADEFYEVYEMNRYELRANFVTVDSLMHTYHLYFSHLLKGCERATLSDRVAAMGGALLDESLAQREVLAGTEWDGAVAREVAFFAVAQELMGEDPQVPDDLSAIVSAEVERVRNASAMDTSNITGGQEDYSQYKPRGYYEGDELLERYFRTMMWYGRTNFTQSDEDLDRTACLITLALHDAALSDWEAVYAITSFFAGASDDCGYYEYEPVLEATFGANPSALDLVGNTDAWNSYHAATATMEAPRINSVVYVAAEDADSSQELEEQKGFRLMGQRFSLDEAIFEQLLPDAIGTNDAGEERALPSGLDVTAALGSDTALSILSDEGVTGYEGYTDQMERLRTAIANAGDSLWTASLYSQWLYTLNPLLAAQGEGCPDFMRTAAWERRDLETYLGSYAELKHDTVLYAKQVMVEMGGGGIDEVDDRGYVEPVPELYRRMANLVTCTSSGLSGYDALGDDDASNLQILSSLAGQLADIAEAELAGTALTDNQYELIRGYGGQLEHFWEEVYKNEPSASGLLTSRDFPAAIVTDVASNAKTGTCLELATGRVSETYVLFELEGALHLASGASYSYYEFEQPLSERLTDTEWREMMGIEAGADMSYSQEGAVTQPSWVGGFTYDPSSS